MGRRAALMPLLDRHDRPLRSLRISVTDRCNLRCSYCMPAAEYRWIPHEAVLRYEEILRLLHHFLRAGVRRVRITGGEPLLRLGLDNLVRMLAGLDGIEDLALTTNGVLLAEQAAALRAAGLGRLTISLDTLDRERFRRLTRRDDLARVLAGIEAAAAVGFAGTKLNTVVVRGFNEDEIPSLLAFGREHGVEVRFIEYMDVGGGTGWSEERVVPQEEILARVASAHGAPQPVAGRGSAPAARWRLPDGTVFGVIAATTAPFCADCDRSRITADGHWFTCLHATRGHDFRSLLRGPGPDQAIAHLIESVWRRREDRGAEEARARRLAGGPEPPAGADRHAEMHVKGG
ncbi:MAG: GTP 3',8-cyclase MoaA [Planctomycetota bacterium]|nr:MAG: GTP 3',8-cyclase MoaA [Planctomycetota bacterium]